MSTILSIQTPSLFHIRTGATLSCGANQEWYIDVWQKRAGCGPTVSSHLVWYLSRTRPGCENLCLYDGAVKAGFLQLMEDMWNYVTPGRMGVNTTEILTSGLERYGAGHQVPLRSRTLQVPMAQNCRPSAQCLREFLSEAMEKDLPVAFLNLSNGILDNLDSWHWVTLTAVDPDLEKVTMIDQGAQRDINLNLWLKTSLLGGGFVTVQP